MRLKIINLSIIFIFLIVGFAILNLEIVHGRKYRDLGEKNCIRLISQRGSRGRILDRNGELIVGSFLSYDLAVLPQENSRIEKTLTAISGVLGVSFKELKDRFNKEYSASFIPVTVAKNINVRKAIALGELQPDYNGIIIQAQPLRSYPYGKLACQVVGYLNEIDHWRLTKLEDYGYKTKDVVGFGGLEEKYDYYLRGNDGALSVEVDHKGKLVRVLGFKPPSSGKDVQLTLDLKIQKIVEDMLGERNGSVVLMQPYSGEIIAMANSPGFNPSLFINKENSSLASLQDSALINRSISGLYPSASVFKLVGASAALETGKISLATAYFCSGHTLIGNREFKCWETHHEEKLAEAIAHSCDVFFYKVGLLLGPQMIHDYALKFGLSKLTGIDLPYEASGFVPDPIWKRISRFQKWFDGDTANLVIGQGDLMVTPIQIARLIGVFANKGKLVTPYIVKNIGGKEMFASHGKNINIAIKASVVSQIRRYLRDVVSSPSGTANVLSALPISVAGKTGTAQVSRGKTHGWFAGFFPFENPGFVVCVLLENNGSGFAASVLAKQIIEEMIKENLIEKA